MITIAVILGGVNVKFKSNLGGLLVQNTERQVTIEALEPGVWLLMGWVEFSSVNSTSGSVWREIWLQLDEGPIETSRVKSYTPYNDIQMQTVCVVNLPAGGYMHLMARQNGTAALTANGVINAVRIADTADGELILTS